MPTVEPPLAQLQQQAGNQAMQQLLRAGIIHAKLAISQPDDPEEQEANRTADRIMRSHAGASATATPCSCGSDEDEMCDECKQKASGISRQATQAGPVHAGHRVLDTIRRSSGHPLDAGARAFFEPRFGRDFSHVRIHTDSPAADSARSIRAHAFTAGSDVFFSSGLYAPHTESGKQLLAHELTHTVQQSHAGLPGSISSIGLGRVNDPMETEAHRVSRSVMGAADRAPSTISSDDHIVVRGAWYDDALDAVGSAGSWVGGKLESGGEAVAGAATWVGNKAEQGAEWVGNKVEQGAEWAGDKAEAAGKWALGKFENAWDCLQSLGKGAANLATGEVHSLTDLLGIPAPQGADPSTLDTIVATLRHPCLQMIPGYGLVSGAVGLLEKAGKFLVGAYHLMQNPEPIIDGIRNSIGKMIAGIPAFVSAQVQKALQAVGAKAKEHGEGVWRHLQPKLDYLAKNWWQVIKDTGWQLLWPWPSVGKDLGQVWGHLKSAADNLWNLRFSKAIDDILAVERGVNSILGSLYGWFFIASVLVGAILGGIFGVGAGAIPGAVAGAAFAGEVGEGLLLATVAVESASVLKAVYNLLAQKETPDEKEADYEQIASSSLTLAITGVMFVLSEIAVKFAQGLLSRVAGLFRKAGAEVEDVATVAGKTARGDVPDTQQPKVDVDTSTSPDAKSGDVSDRQSVDTEETPDGMDPVTGEPVEKLPDGGEARVTEDGRCEICHSPCQFTEQKLKLVRDSLQHVRDALADAPTKAHFAQLDNLLRRLQLLEDEMSESASRGMLKTEFNVRFRDSFRRLSLEAETAFTDLFDPDEFSYDPNREFESWNPDEPGSEFNDPKSRYDPERALEGTAFHDAIESAIVKEFPPGSALTENTVRDFLEGLLRKRGLKPENFPGIPKRSSGIDLYILDRATTPPTVTPVDITSIAGGAKHVEKLGRNFDAVEPAFKEVGFTMRDPIEIEYLGQTFDEAVKNIVNELKAFAR